MAGSSSSLWKWHRRLGHLSFDLLCRLSSLDLIQGLPKLKFEKDLVCHPCRHGKMVAASHSPVTKVMTSHPGELLHMDTVGPARVCSFGGKWYVLVVVDDFSRYSWVFFMTRRMRLLLMLEIWFFGCKMSFLKMPWELYAVTMAHNSKILNLQPFVLLWDSSISFPLRMCPSRMVLLNAKIGPLLRWPGWCLMSIGLLGVFGPKRSTLLAMCPIASFFGLFWTELLMSCDLDDHPRTVISGYLVAYALC